MLALLGTVDASDLI